MKFNQNIRIIENQDEPVVILLNPNINGLGVIRSLAGNNVKVIALGHKRTQIGMFSKYCKSINCPDPNDEEKYISFLIEFRELFIKKPVIFPISDKVIRVISKHKKELEKYYTIPLSKYSVVETLFNKEKFYTSLENLNMPYPKTQVVTDIEDAIRKSKEFAYPFILKPTISINFFDIFQKKVFIIKSKKDLIDSLQSTYYKNFNMLMQEIIPGSDSNMHLVSGFYDKSSKPVGLFTFQRLKQYPNRFGNGAICISKQNKELSELLSEYIKKIKYTGFVDAEFKLDPRDGSYKFIEINPRTGLQNSLSTRCGVNIPYLGYQCIIGNKNKTNYIQEDGVKWIFIINDIASSLEGVCNDQRTFYNWYKLVRGKKIYAIFDWLDPMPSLISIPNYIIFKKNG